MPQPLSVRWTELPVRIIQGTRAVQDCAPLLEQLAADCGVAATMSGLKFILKGRGDKQKLRTLVLFLKPDANPTALHPGDLLGSLLTFELLLLGIRTGAYATADRTATRTVIAPCGEHGAVAAAAAEVLLSRGGNVVLTSHIVRSKEEIGAGAYLTTPGLVWGNRHRCYRQQMDLADTYDGTLARIGKTTRAHMRYYRKRLDAMFDLEFVPDVRQCMTEWEYAAFNMQSRYPVSAPECAARWRIPDEPGGYTIGLRTRQGEWLSIIGGWRQGETVLVEYQFNTEDYPKESVSSAMRCYLLETEVARGSRVLCIPQGTPHSMINSFDEQHSQELVVYRNTLGFQILRSLADTITHRNPGSITRLARAIVGDGRAWHVVGERVMTSEVAAEEMELAGL